MTHLLNTEPVFLGMLFFPVIEKRTHLLLSFYQTSRPILIPSVISSQSGFRSTYGVFTNQLDFFTWRYLKTYIFRRRNRWVTHPCRNWLHFTKFFCRA